jgi:hypothetical protein
MRNTPRFFLFLYTFFCGLVGVLSFLPAILVLVEKLSLQDMPSTPVLLLATGIQNSLVLAIGALVGVLTSEVSHLKSPLATAYLKKDSLWKALSPQVLPGIFCGILGAILAHLFSPSFIEYLRHLPFYSRIFYGGFTEEILVRWGLMSFLAWLYWRVIQKKQGKTSSSGIILAVGISELIFVVLHFPLLNLMVKDPVSVSLVILLVSLPWGYLFWKWGLEAAILGHTTFHLAIWP